MKKLIYIFLLMALLPWQVRAADKPVVSGLEIEQNAYLATVNIELSKRSEYTSFTLTSPDRLVIDVYDASWQVLLPPQEYDPSSSMVKRVRHGLLPGDKLRIVLELHRKATIKEAMITPITGEGDDKPASMLPHRLSITFYDSDKGLQAVQAMQRAQDNREKVQEHLAKQEERRNAYRSSQDSPLKAIPTVGELSWPSYDEMRSRYAKDGADAKPDSRTTSKAVRPAANPAAEQPKQPPEHHASTAIAARPAYKASHALNENDTKTKTEARSFIQNPPDKPATFIRRKPVIVLDAGHGGMDPGAIGKSGVMEKNVTLRYTLELARMLRRTGRYNVYLTRNKDVYVNLGKRVEKARALKADLFISLHADSHKNPDTRGLSVYTISEARARREAGKLLRDADSRQVIRDVNLRGQADDVQHMIIDLAQRQTKNASANFAEILVYELRKEGARLLRNTHRFAGFKVLTGADVPSVLLELGYLSNAYEERMLQRSDYRNRLLQGITDSIDRFFATYPI